MELGPVAEQQETDIERMFSEVVEQAKPQMAEKQIEFDSAAAGKDAGAGRRQGQDFATLVNLLGNAAKYTPERGRVTFRVKSATSNW